MSDSTDAMRWLSRAHQDIGAAEACLQVDPDGLADPIGYSSHQACEKALKALLLYHGVGAPRTHDLPILLQLCLQFAPSLAPIESSLFLPNQFGIDGRYPQADHPVAMDEAIAALDAARALVREVCLLMGTTT